MTLKVKLILDSPPTHQSSHRSLHSLNWKGKFILPRISIWIEFIKELILIQIGRHIKIGSREECLSQFRRCLCVIYMFPLALWHFIWREKKNEANGYFFSSFFLISSVPLCFFFVLVMKRVRDVNSNNITVNS